MSKRILHVSIHPESKPPDAGVLVGILDRAPDWVEYAPHRWLLWTSASAEIWYSRFRKVLANEDGLLIFATDVNEYVGYLPASVWEWLRKYVPQRARTEKEDA
jgi:hypothetical protein